MSINILESNGNNIALTGPNVGRAASGANSDITSLSGITTPLSIAQGGSGGATAAAAIASLGAMPQTIALSISATTTLSVIANSPPRVTICSNASSINVTLPPPVAGMLEIIKRAGAGNVVILPAASQTIDGSANFTLSSALQTTTVTSDGVNYYLV